MTDLTKLTLKAALDGLKAKSFSSEEITQAFVDAIDAVEPGAERLCPRDAGQGAGHGPGLRRAAAQGRGRARWKACRWGSRTCSAPRACSTTAGSNILRRFRAAL